MPVAVWHFGSHCNCRFINSVLLEMEVGRDDMFKLSREVEEVVVLFVKIEHIGLSSKRFLLAAI